MEVSDLSQLPEVDADEFPPFSDEDLVTAMFAAR